MLEKIISGGQTGVDRAALDVGLALGLKAGGWCPQGRRAEDGVIPERYPLVETPERNDQARTRRNVEDSDGTLILNRGTLDGGTALTVTHARQIGKSCRVVALEEGMHRHLAIAAIEESTVMTELVRRALGEWLERRGQRRLHGALPRPAARGNRAAAYPRNRPRGTPAFRHLQRPAPRADNRSAPAFVRCAAVGHPEDRRSDPLGGRAAVA